MSAYQHFPSGAWYVAHIRVHYSPPYQYDILMLLTLIFAQLFQVSICIFQSCLQISCIRLISVFHLFCRYSPSISCLLLMVFTIDVVKPATVQTPKLQNLFFLHVQILYIRTIQYSNNNNCAYLLGVMQRRWYSCSPA